MSNVMPEFLERYNYTLDLINRTAEEGREYHRQWEIKQAKRDEEYNARQAKRDREYDLIEKRLKHQERNYGRFTEGFVRRQLIRVLAEWDIHVNKIGPNIKIKLSDGQEREFDCIAENGSTIVIVEVKSTLQQNEIEYFLKKLKELREKYSGFDGKKIIGAVAFIHDAPGSIEMAQNVGLLTILATASSAKITNPIDFQPRKF